MDTITLETKQGPMSIITQPMPPIAMPRQAPDVPAGWTVGPPHFVGVGAARAGTTWWFGLLAQHPRMAPLPSHKELHYFDHYMGVAEFEPADYHRYFPRPEGSVCGEWTPRYMYDFWTPAMLRRAAPAARILVMLRDPVERYLSNLALVRSRGLAVSHSLLNHHVERGMYASQLRRVLAYFPREQVLVQQYEQCAAEPAVHVRRTFEFLGLDPDEWRPAQPPSRRVNESAAAKPDLDPANREALEAAFRTDLEALFALEPGLDPALWPSAHAAK